MSDKIVIFMNDALGKKWSRGKYAAHAVHAALKAFGVHPDLPVVVLGAKPRNIEKMRVFIHDEGRTELEPGTLTAGTDYEPMPTEPDIATLELMRQAIHAAAVSADPHAQARAAFRAFAHMLPLVPHAARPDDKLHSVESTEPTPGD